MNTILNLLIILGFCTFFTLVFYEPMSDHSLLQKGKRYVRGKRMAKTYAIITFQQFKRYYDLNPGEYYDLDGEEPEASFGRIGYKRVFNKDRLPVFNYEHKLAFQSFWDYLQYIHFLKKKKLERERKEVEEERNISLENTASYYKAVIGDIENIRKIAQEEADYAKTIIDKSSQNASGSDPIGTVTYRSGQNWEISKTEADDLADLIYKEDFYDTV